MKTLSIFIAVFVMALCSNLLAEEENKTRIKLVVNGHERYLNDALFDTLTANWQENVDSLERKIKKEFKSDDGRATTVHVSNKINGLKIKYDDAAEELYTRLILTNNSITFKTVTRLWKFYGWKPSVKKLAKLKFDIDIIVKTEIFYDSLKIKQRIKDIDVDISNISNRSNLLGYVDGAIYQSLLLIVDAFFLDDIFSYVVGEELEFWIKTDRKTALRAFRIIEEVMRNPFQGIGKPEPLRYLAPGTWSRRLTQEHRIVYLVKDERIDFLQARYHY